MRTIDCRGLSCPQPVVMLHQALASDASSPLDILVDNEASVENVSRAARKKGFAVEAKSEADGATRLELRK